MKLLNNEKLETVFKYLNLVVLLGIFSLLVYRAATLTLTHDEAITYSLHSSTTYIDILQYNTPIASNNHLLNTILIKIFTKFLGDSELIIRLPSLIGGLLYIISSFGILKLIFKRHGEIFLGIVVLCFNPFIIDFLSCARGYGLALGFSMFSIYLLILKIREKQKDVAYFYTFLTIFSASCSVFSNLSFLNFFLGISFVVGVYDFICLIREKRLSLLKFVQITFPHLINYLLLFVVYYEPVKKMQESGEFYFGGKSGFGEDTIASLIKSFWADRLYATPFVKTITGLIIIILLIILFLRYLKYSKRGSLFKDKNVELVCLCTLISIVSASIIFQNILLETLFVVDRAAIYFIPIFILIIIYLFRTEDNLPTKHFLLSVLLIISFHHVFSINWQYFNRWKYDANSKQAISYIADDCFNCANIKVGITWLFEPSMNYYIRRDYSDKIEDPLY